MQTSPKQISGLMIAAPRSGSGKTLVTLGLMRALSRQGLAIAAAKSGPDYIDPAFHRAACGRASFNLDSWAMSGEQISALVAQSAEGTDLLIAEASMGLFDGVPAEAGRNGSSADVASILSLPIILVIDVSGQAQSAAAVAKGFASFDPRINIAGVIFNCIASPRHERLVREAMKNLDLPVLGCLPREAQLTLPERHLGLVQAGEIENLQQKLDKIADFVARYVDLDTISKRAGPVRLTANRPSREVLKPPGQTVALAFDAAFSFIYPHVLDAWQRAGAAIRTFSPLLDEAPDLEADICWLPGGYPELHAGKIASCQRFLQGLARFAKTAPVHGECGGYMALGQSLEDAKGITHAMSGLLGISTSFAKRKLHLGYRRAQLIADHPLGERGAILHGHEFHYAVQLPDTSGDDAFVLATDAYGSEPAPMGSRRGNVSGSFFHLLTSGI